MIRSIQLTAFLAVIFSFILQTGKHFWPAFAYVGGAPIDYLAPTLYVSDIAIILLVIIYFSQKSNQKKLIVDLNTFIHPIILLFLLVLILSSLTAKSVLSATYADFKLLEMVVFAYITSHLIIDRKVMKYSVMLLNMGAILVAAIAYAQFYFQHSVGGVLYFLGERTFTVSTENIAKFDMFGTSILRPYATFPHPNVLAYFLLVVVVLTVYAFKYLAQGSEKILMFCGIIFSISAIVLSFSRVALLCLLVFLLIQVWLFLQRYNPALRLKLFSGAGILLAALFLFELRINNFVLFVRDVAVRIQLIDIASILIQKHFFLGVGLHNFIYYELDLQKTFSPAFLQPVHNIYLLVFAELGVVGFFVFIYFLLKTGNRLWTKMKDGPSKIKTQYYYSVFFLFVSALCMGLFDHYMLTLQQGLLVSAFIIGLAWARFRGSELEKEWGVNK